jgi:NNP family nitrate/nitrite transporter-like MFS transporter
MPILRYLLPAIALLALCASLLPSLETMGLLCLAVVTLFGFGNGVVFKLVGDRFADRIGAATGVIGAAGALGGFLLPLGFGLLTEATGAFHAAFLLLAVLSTMACAAIRPVGLRPAGSLDRVESFSH